MIKQFDRLRYMDYLINIESTGTLKDFANKLNVSRSTCGEYIRILRGLGAKIEYSSMKRTYIYSDSSRIFIGYK